MSAEKKQRTASNNSAIEAEMVVQNRIDIIRGIHSPFWIEVWAASVDTCRKGVAERSPICFDISLPAVLDSSSVSPKLQLDLALRHSPYG